MVNPVSETSHHGDALDAETAAWLRLLLTPGVGRSTARRLLARAGSAQSIWQLPRNIWGECASSAQVQALSIEPAGWASQCTATARWLNEPETGLHHALITLGHPQYPDCLLHSEDPPLLLFLQASAELLTSDLPWFPYPATLAMVGSRNPTAQGLVNAKQMAHALAESGLCIVSGLARGIDAAAHEGALLAGTPAHQPCTIAVVGTGLDQVYPAAHRKLARQIAERGLVVSEYLLGSGPLARHFPQRNRIISGLSQGTLVVEAAVQSGSLITARLAMEQGREVFAIPGSIHAPQAKGCHALLRQGATLVETAQNVLEELQGIKQPQALTQQSNTAIKTEGTEEHPLLTSLGYDPMTLDALVARTGWDASHLQAQLMELELDNFVARLPGGMYQRITRS